MTIWDLVQLVVIAGVWFLFSWCAELKEQADGADAEIEHLRHRLDGHIGGIKSGKARKHKEN